MRIDHTLMAFTRRLHLAIWRSYAMQAAACVGGALLATCATQCALDSNHGHALICTVGVVLAFVVFDYAGKAGARARSMLENIDRS